MEHELQESIKSVSHMEMLLHDLKTRHRELEQRLEKIRCSFENSGRGRSSGTNEFYEASLSVRRDNLKRTIDEISYALDKSRLRMIYVRKAIRCFLLVSNQIQSRRTASGCRKVSSSLTKTPRAAI